MGGAGKACTELLPMLSLCSGPATNCIVIPTALTPVATAPVVKRGAWPQE